MALGMVSSGLPEWLIHIQLTNQSKFFALKGNDQPQCCVSKGIIFHVCGMSKYAMWNFIGMRRNTMWIICI